MSHPTIVPNLLMEVMEVSMLPGGSIVVCAVAVLIIANYLASVIDGLHIGIGSPGIIQCCVSAMAVQKAVIDAVTVSVSPDNLSSFVNA
jgi:hypothetical protein